MRYRGFGPALTAMLLLFTPWAAHAQDVLISEFMASNARALADENGAYPDWLELYNPGDSPVDLDGWYLTQNPASLAKWRIPAVTLPAQGFLVIFCDKTDKAVAGAPLHTNFKLSASGDYLALVKPDGVTIACEYTPMYPPQQTDVSYGMAFTGSVTTLIAPGSPAKALVPVNGDLGMSWTATDFNDSGWSSGATGIGYERGSGYESMIGLDVGAEMYNITPSAYIRILFNVEDAASVDKLTLRMKVDDGFVAYLNGIEVAAFQAPTDPVFNSPATANYDDTFAVQYQDFDISAGKSALTIGANVLAIQGFNVSNSSSDFLILPELVASTGGDISPGALRYFAIPTPGARNGTGSADQGPSISQVSGSPVQPAAGQSILVTARITPQASPLAACALNYRVHFGALVSVPMHDDGAHGDGDSGDGVFAATIPSSAYAAGQMVRYYVSATDSAGHAGRFPVFANPAASPEFLGTMVKDPTVASALPVLYWFVADPEAAGTESGTPSSLFYNGVFYDNVFSKVRGQSSEWWPKKHYNFTMNSGAYFETAAAKPLDEFNLQSSYSDKSYIRPILGWETYANAGVPGCFTFPVRVQQNGAFFSVATILEQPGADFLTRINLDADGALYKMYSDASTTDGVEKKTRKQEDASDLVTFLAGLPSTGSALTAFLFDNVDVPEAINYIAATTIMHDNDHVGKNYFLYRDSDGNRLWSILPWDKDLTFGRNFVPWDGGVLSDTIWANVDPYSHPLFGDAQHPKVDGPWNRVIDALLREPTIRQMYLRRLRTLMDDLLQPPGTPAASLKFEKRIGELVALLAPDVTLDRAKWGNPYGANQDFGTAIGILKSQYLAVRRTHLYNTHSAPTPNGIIPTSAVSTANVSFGAADAIPASGNQDEEYLTITNSGSAAVDISGWTLSGDITFTFVPGTVVPGNKAMYVSPRLNAFRARTVSPTGGEGLFVVGDYHGHLQSSGGLVTLKTVDGATIAVYGYTLEDVQAVLKMAAGLGSSDGAALSVYDVVPDGVLDVSDATRLLRRVVGLDN